MSVLNLEAKFVVLSCKKMSNNQRGGFEIPDVGNIDVKKLSPLYGAPAGKQGPDFITSQNKRGRDTYGQLVFNTGVTWLGAFTLAGIYGGIEGLRGAANPSFKVKMNSVMNGISRRGSVAGNAFGVVGM